jgi:hypothetical protein
MNTKSKDRSLAICLLGKFFPTQGGMAASLYWQADALSKKNIDVKVISNGNLVEDQYRIKTG